MSAFENTLTDVFERGGERRFASASDEQVAIAAAKLGDEAATIALIYAYAPALRNAVGWYTRSAPYVDRRAGLEDIYAQAVSGLLEAVQAFELGTHARLAALAHGYITNAVAVAAAAATGFAVPERTLKRFFSILRKADGNVYEAAALASKFEMNTETFFAVLSAVRSVESYDGLTVSVNEEDGFGVMALRASDGLGHVNATSVVAVATDEEIVEDRILVEAAFRAVDDLEEDVCRLYYGFAEYNTKSDAEIAGDLGLSRPKVQRVRASALGKMRNALGVA